MPALSCSAMTCVYNQNELCSKGDIRVGGSEAKSSMETCCESFKERGEGTMSNSTGCGCTKIGVDCKAQNGSTVNDNCNAKPETSISPETAHAAARKPSAAPSAVAAGNKYEKMRKSVLTTGWESAIL